MLSERRDKLKWKFQKGDSKKEEKGMGVEEKQDSGALSHSYMCIEVFS